MLSLNQSASETHWNWHTNYLQSWARSPILVSATRCALTTSIRSWSVLQTIIRKKAKNNLNANPNVTNRYLRSMVRILFTVPSRGYWLQMPGHFRLWPPLWTDWLTDTLGLAFMLVSIRCQTTWIQNQRLKLKLLYCEFRKYEVMTMSVVGGQPKRETANPSYKATKHIQRTLLISNHY